MYRVTQRSFALIILFVLATLLIGCSATSPVPGALYTNVVSPSGDKVATDAASSEKIGEASCMSVLYLVAWGECSINEAMKNGGINKVHHVDQRSFNVYFFYSRYTTMVYGE
ncbi:MAG: TRL-like protein family [Deltaproteobacteria bacterium]|nr:TRL-like protein family [Deltaproteobacteria bacterium]MBT6614160.1 TRL-like protein family [Deltaproteobacteria bacterium]